jgi:flagellar M-ring protein FliF
VNDGVDLLKRIGAGRVAAMLAVTLALVGFFGFVIMRVTQPAMGVLYTDLSSQDAMAIMRDLDTRGIKYETRADGQTILAPRTDAARLRMELAGKGLPTGGGVGYEIFDKGDAFSATSFVQNINHLRALEGELSRTIRSISRVQSARVHLVIPERRLFERDREGPRASIVLKLAGELDMAQVRAVRHLVATAVEGLKPDRVSIVDERGRLLADGAQGESAYGAVMEEKQSAHERKFRTQVEEIVARVVGNGRARVQVAVELDTNRIESRSESFDPESRVVRSAQTRTENQVSGEPQGSVSVGNELPGANQGGNASSREATNKNEEITNYEISRTTRTEVVEGGRLKRLSVAVLIDGIYVRSANGEMQYQPRPQEELDRINALVRTSVGLNRERGDQLEIVNLRFADAPTQADIKEQSFMSSLFTFTKEDMLHGVELLVLAVLTLIVLFTVVKPMVRTILGPDLMPKRRSSKNSDAPEQIENDSEPAALPRPRESQAQRMIEIAQVNGQVQAQSVERVGEIVKNNPQESAAILRQWIQEPA